MIFKYYLDEPLASKGYTVDINKQRKKICYNTPDIPTPWTGDLYCSCVPVLTLQVLSYYSEQDLAVAMVKCS